MKESRVNMSDGLRSLDPTITLEETQGPEESAKHQHRDTMNKTQRPENHTRQMMHSFSNNDNCKGIIKKEEPVG